MVDSNGDVKILSLASTSVDDNEPAVLIGNLSTDLLRMQTIGFDLGKENSRVPPPRSKGFFKRASSHKHNILRRASIGAAIGEVLRCGDTKTKTTHRSAGACAMRCPELTHRLILSAHQSPVQQELT
eukprot:1536017-Rhodomonas_salina.1